jgi:hypothetical protein
LIIFGFLPQISKTKTVAVGVSVQQARGLGEQAQSARLDDLAVFRCVFYDCLTLRADALFELTDAVLCADGLSASRSRPRTMSCGFMPQTRSR